MEELGPLTAAMPERLQLMVTLASWCALRFGETVELRRGDIDLSQEVIRIRRAAVRTKGAYTITTPKSDAGVRDVAIPPHIIPAIEQHLAKYVDKGVIRWSSPRSMAATWHPPHCNGTGTRPGLRPVATISAGTTCATPVPSSPQPQARHLAELMARLGHSTPQAAMRYQHAAQARDREIAALLSKLATGSVAP